MVAPVRGSATVDTTQEELIAALVRRLEGRTPYVRRQPEHTRIVADETRVEADVLIDLEAEDGPVIEFG